MKGVYFFQHLPNPNKVLKNKYVRVEQALVICDQKLKKHPDLKTWHRDKSIFFYFIKSGEEIKSVEKIETHLKKINAIKGFNKTDFAFISMGGGSLGDLTGFLASIYKRGKPLIHIPTTYLSALDSAHGGKNGLNFQNVKNFVGTYYFPKAVFIVKFFFKSLPKKQKDSAYGELLKMALISNGTFYKQLQKDFLKYKYNYEIEKFIKPCFLAKTKIVEQDPYEKNNLRKTLNLGHTVGHALESASQMPHGLSVLHGLLFSLEWSFHKKFINKKMYEEIKTLIPIKRKKISAVVFKKFIKQDKKYKSFKQLDFVFIKRPGQIFIKTIKENDLFLEAKRQNII